MEARSNNPGGRSSLPSAFIDLPNRVGINLTGRLPVASVDDDDDDEYEGGKAKHNDK